MNQWNKELDALNVELAERRRAQKWKLHDCGDHVWLRIYENADEQMLNLLCEELKTQYPNGNMQRSQLCDNRFFHVEINRGYLYGIFLPCCQQLRLMVAEQGRLIPHQLGEKDTYSGTPGITQITPDAEAKNFGMCYVIALGEGHFLLYDGLGSAGHDEEKIYSTLLQHTPEGCQPVIDAWILTHLHYDHIAGVQKFADRYSKDVRVLHFVMNMPDPHYFPVRLWREVADFYASWMPGICKAFPEAAVWKVHTGQRFSVGGAEVEVLLTQEELYPDEVKVNDTSLVTRVFLNGKRLFFPADISGEKGCRLLHEMYGSYLHSEYYQIAHHAWDTEALLFYDDVDPEELFWPLRRKDWDPGNRMWTFPATKVMKAELDEGKRNFLIAMDENIQVEL